MKELKPRTIQIYFKGEVIKAVPLEPGKARGPDGNVYIKLENLSWRPSGGVVDIPKPEVQVIPPPELHSWFTTNDGRTWQWQKVEEDLKLVLVQEPIKTASLSPNEVARYSHNHFRRFIK